MNFGDWEMFRVLIVSLREHEMTTVRKQSETRSFRMAMTKQQSAAPSRERKASVPKINNDKDSSKVQGDGNMGSSKNKQSIMEKQVTLEDQMICGALQTLNEEACEDVLEETEDVRPDTEIPQTSIIPPSPDSAQDIKASRSRTNSTTGLGETDFVMLQSSPIGFWQPVSISVHGNAESLSDHSSVGNSLPPSPVGERQRKPEMRLSNIKNVDPVEPQRKGSKHVVIKMEKQSSCSSDSRRSRPSSLHILKESKISKQFGRNRSKSIDNNAQKRMNESKTIGFEKLKEKLLHSNPDLNDDSDTESTPLVSQVVSPVTSPEYKRDVSSSSTSNSGLLTPDSHNHVQVAKKYMKRLKKGDESLVDLYEFSPTRSLNDDVMSDTSLYDDSGDANWFGVPQGRVRTMSECADSAVSYALEPGSQSLTASNISLYSKYSQSCCHLYRQDALDSEENIADVYCDPETRV